MARQAVDSTRLRKRSIGQWFTPLPVAKLAVALAMRKPRPASGPCLDPAVGEGVFFRAAQDLNLSPTQWWGFDTDAAALATTRSGFGDAQNLNLREQDFLSAPKLPKFSTIVGNPPYVAWANLSAGQRSALLLGANSPPGESLAQPDLSMFFLLRCLGLLAENGTCALVLSSAIFYAKSSEKLFALVAELAAIEYVVVPSENWFADAEIKPVLVVFRKRYEIRPMRVVHLTCSAETAVDRLLSGNDLETLGRVLQANTVSELRRAIRGVRDELYHAVTERWVPLSSMAQVKRGLTSGLNPFFYPSQQTIARFALPDQALAPILRSNKRMASIFFDVTQCANAVFVPPDASDRKVAEYIAAFAHFQNQPTLRARSPWWKLVPTHARTFLRKAYARSFVQPFASEPVASDQRFYSILPYEFPPELFSAVLNSSAVALVIECHGRASMGGGALELSVDDANKLPVPQLASWSESHMRNVLRCFHTIKERSWPQLEEPMSQAWIEFENAVLTACGISRNIEELRAAHHEMVVARIPH